jgi:flagellar biosynthesis/type III secretory pathway protein FliH
VDELLAQAHERAREIIMAAEAAAAAVRGGAAEELRRARLAASADGHAEGMARAAAALALAADVREAKLAELDGALIEVALEIARQLVGRELAAAPEAIVDVAKRALRVAAGTGDIVLKVAPADLATIRDAGGSLRALVEQGSLALSEDAGLLAGEVVVESAGGRVDARIAAQLDAFRRALQAEGR